MKIPSYVVGVMACVLSGLPVSGAVTLTPEQVAQAPQTSLPAVGRGTAASSDEAAAVTASRAFDGFLYTSWTTTIPAGGTGWLEYRFDEDIRWVLTGYSVSNGAAGEEADPREWELQGSNDGANWTKLDAKKRQVFISRRKTNTYRLERAEAYNRYRVVFAATGGATPLEVGELGFTVKALAQPPDKVVVESERGCTVVSWPAVETATGYSIRRAGELKGPYVLLASGVRETSYTDRGPFGDSETCYYTVSTDVAAPQGVMSVPIGVATPVAAPANLKATPGGGLVVLEWTPSPKAVAYVVRRSLVGEGPYTVIGSQITAPAYTDEGLSAGTAYHYVVCGVANGKEGVDSAPVSVRFPPLTPTGLAAEPGKEMVTLTWNAVALATSYKIMRASAADAPAQELAVVTEGTTYVDRAVNANKTGHYTVRAVNDCGTSGVSDPVSAAPLRPAVWWRR
jgi:fibronectin type 3 domain-containing protein